MPTTLIEVRTRYSQEQELALIDAVHAALQQAFKLPPNDKNIRLVAHEPHRFACPPNKSKPEACTLVTINAFAGRSLEAKRQLYSGIVENLAQLGIPRDHVLIALNEIPRENWGIQGKAAVDIDLGFKVDV
jgi:phenylpyruvate tautomerase PptA (4-oxalocrotonate tautomerase family)